MNEEVANRIMRQAMINTIIVVFMQGFMALIIILSLSK